MKKARFIIALVLILGLFTLVITLSSIVKNNSNNLKIYFFNAGKADAIILSKDNHNIMIDTGESNLSSTVLQYFKNNNIERLDYLIITHFDKDHVGSASEIINNIEIGEVLQSNSPKESTEYNNYLTALSRKGITPITVSGDYAFPLADLEITVNGPEDIYDSNQSNNSSLIISVIDDQISFLFMGDAENPRIKDFLDTNQRTYNFLKVPYHGNYLKKLDNLLTATKPQYAVITASNSEPAAEETLEVLQAHDVEYYLTNMGDITITSDGKDIKIQQ